MLLSGALHGLSTQMRPITDWPERLDTEILAQKSDQALLSSLSQSTTILIEGPKATQKAAEAFSFILENHTAQRTRHCEMKLPSPVFPR